MFAVLHRRALRIPTKDVIFVGPEIFGPKVAVFVKSFSSKTSSPGVCRNDSVQSFTVSYLINSCGLSSKEALVASKKLQIKSQERSDEVLELFRNYEFTNAQIPRLVNRWPLVLSACPKNNLLPKLEFFRSMGVPLDVLAQKLSLYPSVLKRSLEHYLIPFYNFLKSIIKSDKKVVYVFRRVPRAFAHGWQREITTNIDILRERGVPESSIALMLAYHPSLLLCGKDKFIKYADQAAKMGFGSKSTKFAHALLVFADMSESTLQHKMDVYRRCGWSKSDINTAFRKYPLCMKLSEEKIMANMDFLVNKMGLEPDAIVQRPLLLCFSLEKRIKPRCLVVGILNGKGLSKRKMSIVNWLTISENNFLKWYILDFKDDVPNLLDIYQGKLSFTSQD